MRANDRTLLFPDVGVTRDHAPERRAHLRGARRRRHRHHRQGRAARAGASATVYELLDLGYGHCRMVVAARAGDDPLGSRCAGSARCGSRPSTRASPPRTSRDTGRQAEIVEVKGSVELGAADRARRRHRRPHRHGPTLRENHLVVREEIADCTARLIANPVAHKLKARRSTRWWSGSVRLAREDRAIGRRRARGDARRARAAPAGRRGRGRARSSTRCARGGDAARARAHRALRPAGAAPERAARAAERARGALGALEPDVLRGLRARDRERARGGARRELRDAGRASSCREGQRVELAELPVRRAGVYVPGGRAPYPSTVVMCAVTARVAGVERARGRARRPGRGPATR